MKYYSTYAYRFSHGKAPRGFGVWAFGYYQSGGQVAVLTPHAMKFAEAKRWVAREYPGVFDFEVLP